MNLLKKIPKIIRKVSSASNDEFEAIIEKIIGAIGKVIAESQELRERFMGYNGIYQISIYDLDVHFWLEFNGTSLIYKRGMNPEFNIQFFITKQLLIDIMMLKRSGGDAYMKALIKIKGDLSYALKFRNALNTLIKYVRLINKKG
jgi:hypothetical protein